MKHVPLLVTLAVGLFFMPSLAWLVPVIRWAMVIVAGTTLTTVTAFFVGRWLKWHFPEPSVTGKDG